MNMSSQFNSKKSSASVTVLECVVAFLQHCSDDDSTTRPLLLVTASVDKMVLKKPLRVDTDLKIEGAVTWVGRSSIEIQIEVTQNQQGIHDPSFNDYFLPYTRPSLTVKSIIPSSNFQFSQGTIIAPLILSHNLFTSKSKT